MTARAMLGTQGWAYKSWIGSFYDEGTRSSHMLSAYAKSFSTVEVDATFYGLPADAQLSAWRSQVPPDFAFALKVPQAVTHERRLLEADVELNRFLERVSQLGDRLGPLLLQLSPDFRATPANRETFQAFVEALPSRFRWAVEFRQPGWLDGETISLLERYGVALAVADGRWIKRDTALELARHPTADFVYVRWMGVNRNLTSFAAPVIDRDREIGQWAAALDEAAERVSVIYGYAHNLFQGHAPHSIRRLQGSMASCQPPAEVLRDRAESF